jgi:uncharacterized damage-inducible protein DinB
MTPNDLLAAGIRMSTASIHRMTNDLTPEEFLHQPTPGANCAAWIVGHVAMTLHRCLGRIGVANLPPVPDDVAAKFQVTKAAAGKQDALGEPEKLISMLDDRSERLQAAFLKLPPDALTAEMEFQAPGATNRAEMLLFLSLHSAIHSGQISTIRRSLGKPPLV